MPPGPPGGPGGYPPAGPPGGPGYPPQFGGPGMPAQAMTGPGGPPKKGGSGLMIALFAVLGVVVLGGIGVAIWLFVGGGEHIDSKAHAHLPAGCDAVVRMDVKGLLSVPAVKEHVIPALDEAAKKSEDASSLAAFLITAELDPKKDIDEVVLCLKDIDKGGEPTMLFVVGGHLMERGILTAVERHVKKEKVKETRKEGDLEIIEAKDDKFFLTQASDAAILFSNDEKLLIKGADKTKEYEETYKIPLDEQVSAIIPEETVKGLSKQAGALIGGNQLNAVGRIVVSATLEPGQISARLEMPSKSAAKELRDALKTLLDTMKQAPGGMGASDPFAAAALNSAKIKTKGNDVIVEIPIPEKLIEEGAKAVAKGIREAEEEI